MVNSILYGITNVLYNNFKDVEIYTDNVEQGLNEPCFFVMVVDSDEEQLLANRAIKNINFDIHYLNKNAANNELEDVASRLYEITRFIDTKIGLVRGMKRHHEITDNVLHFFISFKIVIKYQVEKADKQEDLSVNIGVKDGKEN